MTLITISDLDRRLDYQTVPDAASVHERMSWAAPGVATDTNYSAVYIPDALTPAECEAIVEAATGEEQEQWDWCSATAHGFPRGGQEPALQPLTAVAHEIAHEVWPNYQYYPELSSRLQSYVGPCEGYRLHIDGGPGGPCWKVIVVALLSDPADYEGGQFVIVSSAGRTGVPRGQGGVILMQPFTLHEVTPLTWGERHAFNGGFWGPAWR